MYIFYKYLTTKFMMVLSVCFMVFLSRGNVWAFCLLVSLCHTDFGK